MVIFGVGGNVKRRFDGRNCEVKEANAVHPLRMLLIEFLELAESAESVLRTYYVVRRNKPSAPQTKQVSHTATVVVTLPELFLRVVESQPEGVV